MAVWYPVSFKTCRSACWTASTPRRSWEPLIWHQVRQRLWISGGPTTCYQHLKWRTVLWTELSTCGIWYYVQVGSVSTESDGRASAGMRTAWWENPAHIRWPEASGVKCSVWVILEKHRREKHGRENWFVLFPIQEEETESFLTCPHILSVYERLHSYHHPSQFLKGW